MFCIKLIFASTKVLELILGLSGNSPFWYFLRISFCGLVVTNSSSAFVIEYAVAPEDSFLDANA